MARHSALIVVALAFLVIPAFAAADPTSTQVTAPATTTYVTYEQGQASTLHVAGTTTGGTGDVDLRCYYGNKAPVIKSQVPVAGGAFSTDVQLTGSLMNVTLGTPHPFCMLRAVPTGTVPSAPPDLPSDWHGVLLGWGYSFARELGTGFSPNPPDALWDYFISRAQSKAYSDYNSVGRCGLCDTFLVAPGSLAQSNGIWWGNAVLYANPDGVTDRTAVQIDGADAWTGNAAYDQGPWPILVDNLGFPSLTQSHSVNPANGDLTVDERSPYMRCGEDPAQYPPTDLSCATLADTGVRFERSIRQTDSGQQVTIVDHWKSVDGKAHELDAIYEDTQHSQNALSADRGGRLNFTWTGDGFKGYPTQTQIPLPASVPASVLVQTDASTSVLGDSSNPFGAVTYGTKPSALTVLRAGDGKTIGTWHVRYQRTIPAGGQITVAQAYTHDFALASVQSRRQAAETALTAPSISIDAPADGGSTDAPSAHVTGSVSSPDGQATVKVKGVAATVASDGRWSAAVPLGEGANQILAEASNKIGVVANAIVSVTRVPAPAAVPDGPASPPAPAGVTAPVATPDAVPLAAPARCVVPKLRGKSLSAAKRLLNRAHCRLGKVVRKPSAKVKPGRVLATRLKPGSRVRAGTRVRVTVARKL